MKTIDHGVQWAEKAIICLAFLIMVALTFAQVVARFVFMDPISWSEEVSRFLFVWITMLGAAHAVAFGKHFCVDFLRTHLSAALRRKSDWLIAACVVAFAALMVYYGAFVSWRNQFQVSPAIELRMTYPYLSIPVAGLFTIIHIIAGLFAERDSSGDIGAQGGYAE
jgi:TRAP-type C4-dicarboxylate transport system permease small subunit